MAEHLLNAITDDPAAVSDLADEMMKAAERQGIPASEINEEVDSVFEVISEAMQHRDGSPCESEQAAPGCWRRLARHFRGPIPRAAGPPSGRPSPDQ
jgi:L-serine deaminase